MSKKVRILLLGAVFTIIGVYFLLQHFGVISPVTPKNLVNQIRPIFKGPEMTEKTVSEREDSSIKTPTPPNAQKIDEQISQIKNQIQKVMTINQQVRKRHQARLEQIHFIQEQARAQQRILDEIRSVNIDKLENFNQYTPDVLLAQEKLRAIHEEAQNTMELLEKPRN